MNYIDILKKSFKNAPIYSIALVVANFVIYSISKEKPSNQSLLLLGIFSFIFFFIMYILTSIITEKFFKNKNKTTNKSIIAWIIVIIVVAGLGIALYKNSSANNASIKVDTNNIDSINPKTNSYLSSKDESERSFYIHTNDHSTNNSKSFDFEKFDGRWSLIEFSSNKNNKINIEDNTKITKGKFYIVVLDSNYNIIAEKNELAKKGNIDFTTPKDGKYLIRIVGANASGTFNIKLNSSNNIDISHKDFFS